MDFDHSRFTLHPTASGAQPRRGQLTTPHGTIETPIFMPVGTQASVKSLTPQHLVEVGAQIILGNTYHLNLRPGSDLVHDCGGLHRFMGWPKPILTDSGGYQVFSLAARRKLRPDGVEFQSHIDGRKVFLGPREVVAIQDNLRSDIAMVLDECPPAEAGHAEIAAAVQRSVEWGRACREEAVARGFGADGRQLFGIVQGGRFADLRVRCAEALCEIGFPGYAIGGVSVGEPEPQMLEQVEVTAAVLPPDKPRYVMGVGTPPQLLEMIARGADMFDCVMPSREARHGGVFTPWGKLNLRNNRFRTDQNPLVEGAQNYTCQHFTRAYLRHLLLSGEQLAATLLTIHNLHFFLQLMAEARAHIEAGDFHSWKDGWIERYRSGELP